MKRLILILFIALMIGGCSQTTTEKAICAVTFDKADGCD